MNKNCTGFHFMNISHLIHVLDDIINKGLSWKSSMILDVHKTAYLLEHASNIYSFSWANLTYGCHLTTHYIVNMMICKVRVMFCGKCKWPLRTYVKDFTHFRIQLLVWSGIMTYLLLCFIDCSYCSTCFIYDIVCLIICLY